ncbi:ChaN family lipoprotein [Vibrio alfacsensis]|uniref:ChaN family lipoprotein n=1 Tax=Vibrio alfacsensis TaxID=1074311 RepID=UPI0040686493
MRFLILCLTITATLLGCTSTSPTTTNAPALSSPATDISSFYDYQLYSPTGTSIALSRLPPELQQADVILIGEWHTHAGIHRFQTDMLRQLSLGHRPLALSMEQVTRDKQAILDSYLESEIGEQYFIKQSNAWPNYESDYRPMVEFAKQANIPIIAANAPKSIVRCIGQQGISYLDKLGREERGFVAQTINTDDSRYKEKFIASMHHGQSEQTVRLYAAQITWDETMAESIVIYLTQNPGAQVVHISGKFHIEAGLGTAASILNRNPNLNVVVITPSQAITTDSADYQLKVLAPPVRYVKKANLIQAYQHLGQRNNTLRCK